MATSTPTLDDEANLPWGKYSYICEGLATGCCLEGVDPNPRPSRLPSLGQRLRFRVDLPARCFVLSVAVKLPNAPQIVLPCLDDIVIERALNHGDFQVVYDPASLETKSTVSISSDVAFAKRPTDDVSNDSPTSVDQTSTSHQPLPRKKIMEVRRAADALRISLTDMDDASSSTTARPPDEESDSDDASDGMDSRTLGVVVIGYTRGQTPASNRLRILLNASARLGPNHVSKVDRAEVDGLIGLAFLGQRRYRQAAELLQRAAEFNVEISEEDVSKGLHDERTLLWAAQLNLLSAHAYFEHMAMCNDGIIRLIQVASTYLNPNSLQPSPRNSRDLSTDFLDLRTELLNMLESLVNTLVKFLSESTSPAVRMAAARMIEFISEQLGCGMAPHMATILNAVLRSYPSCVPFGARERAAAASFSYDSMEDCFERLTDICCQLFPLTEHTVLHRLYDNTLIPVFLDAFKESEYLQMDPEIDIPEDLMSTSVAQTLRVIYLSLMILGADARIPTSLISRLLNILVLVNCGYSPTSLGLGGYSRTSLVLRRTALHAWDAVSKVLIQSSSGSSIKSFEEQIKILTSFFPKLLLETARLEFEYKELYEDNYENVQIFKEEELRPEAGLEALDTLLKKRTFRTEIVDRHTLHRVVSLLTSICESLGKTKKTQDEDMLHSEVIFKLQKCVGQAISDVAMSSLLDVSYYEAVNCGNGSDSCLNFEFGDMDNQLNIVSEVLEELFACYWASLNLLPSRTSDETVRMTPVRMWLGWCVDRMRSTAPPKGMLHLMCVVVKGLMNELNTCMFGTSKDEKNPSEITYLSLYRTHLIWLPKTTHEETFELLELLNDSVAGDLLAYDLLLLIRGLGDQLEEFQSQTESSLESLAAIIATFAPKDPDLAIKSMQDPRMEESLVSRLLKIFPSTGRNAGSFNKRASTLPSQHNLLKSFYLHVVLMSCFDRFDNLVHATKKRAGPSYMGDKIDAFVEHAAFVVRCLHVCARSQSHREFVGVALGDIFGTCLAMEDHSDGRVRLAGFEIFAAALDVLFLAQKATMLSSQQSTIASADSAVITMPTTPTCGQSASVEDINGLKDLSSQPDEVTNGGGFASVSSMSTSAVGITTRSISTGDLSKNGQMASSGNGGGGSPRGMVNGSGSNDGKENADDNVDDDDTHGDQKMREIMAEGGSWRFHMEETSSVDLAFEERAWQMLCLFIESSLGVGRFVDFVVQRACLEYLRNCMMNALRGRSSGASVISFEHIETIWVAVSRLVGSPWRALNSLAMWVTCAVVNVSVYATVTKTKAANRQRSSQLNQLNDFVTKRVFYSAEALLKSTSRESRIWGMQLLEVYVRSRDLNPNVLQVIPAAPGRVLRCLQTLKNDWDVDVRNRSQSLLEVHFNSLNRKPSNSNSFTAQAQNFMSIKRHMIDEYDAYDSSRVELWFPPLPKQLTEKELRSYHRKLESFASAPIASGEEVNLVKAADDKSDEGTENDEEEEEEEEEYFAMEETAGVQSEDGDGQVKKEDAKEEIEEEGVKVGETEGEDTDDENEGEANDDEEGEEGEEREAVGVEEENSDEEEEAVEHNTSEDEEIFEVKGHVSDNDVNSPIKEGEDVGSPSFVISTEAEPTSELDEDLESPKVLAVEERTTEDKINEDLSAEERLKDGGSPVGGSSEDTEEEEDFDHEFPSPVSTTNNNSIGSPAGFAVANHTVPGEETTAAVATVANNSNDVGDVDLVMKDENEDFEDEEDVYTVTDFDDPLRDLDSLPVPEEKQRPRPALDVPARMQDNATAAMSGKYKRQSGGMSPLSPRHGSSSKSPGVQLNPDLDEGKKLLRRTGSFTGRPPKPTTIDVGDGPRLARRRSVDVGGSFGDVKGKLEGDDALANVGAVALAGSKLAAKIGKKKSTKGSGPSPKPVGPSGKQKSPWEGVSSERSESTTVGGRVDASAVVGADLESSSLSASGTRLPRRKSMKNVALGPINDGERLPPVVTDGEILSTRVGLEGAELEVRPTVGGSGGGGSSAGGGGGKERSGKANRRSLPRAKAFFVKGGGMGMGIQRKNTGSSIGRVEEEKGSGAGDSEVSGNRSPRLPRSKSQTVRGSGGGSSRTIGGADEVLAEKRPDRSHRFGRREAMPLSLASLDEEPEMERELLNDLDAKSRSHGGEKIVGSGGKRRLTPTTEASAVGSRNFLVGDDGKEIAGAVNMRRGSKRGTTEPELFRRLWDNGDKEKDVSSAGDEGESGDGSREGNDD